MHLENTPQNGRRAFWGLVGTHFGTHPCPKWLKSSFPLVGDGEYFRSKRSEFQLELTSLLPDRID